MLYLTTTMAHISINDHISTVIITRRKSPRARIYYPFILYQGQPRTGKRKKIITEDWARVPRRNFCQSQKREWWIVFHVSNRNCPAGCPIYWGPRGWQKGWGMGLVVSTLGVLSGRLAKIERIAAAEVVLTELGEKRGRGSSTDRKDCTCNF